MYIPPAILWEVSAAFILRAVRGWGVFKCGQGTRFSKYVSAKVLCQWNREWTGVALRLRNSEDVLGASME